MSITLKQFRSIKSLLLLIALCTAAIGTEAQYLIAKISGKVQFRNSDNVIYPAKNVKLMVSVTATRDIVAYSDQEGNYTLDVGWMAPIAGSHDLDIDIKIALDNQNIGYYDTDSDIAPGAQPYAQELTNLMTVSDGRTYTKDITFNLNTLTAQPRSTKKYLPQVWNAFQDACNQVKTDAPSFPLPHLRIRAGDVNAFKGSKGILVTSYIKINFNNFAGIGTNANFLDQVIFHEYGHYIMAAGLNNATLIHSSLDCSRHDLGSKLDNKTCAWVEGWADFFAVYVKYMRSPVGSPFRTAPKFRNTPIELYRSSIIETDGPFDEGRVAAGLWDLFDVAQDSNFIAHRTGKPDAYQLGAPTFGHNNSVIKADNMPRGMRFDTLVNVFIAQRPLITGSGTPGRLTAKEFIRSLKRNNPGDATYIDNICRYNYLEVVTRVRDTDDSNIAPVIVSFARMSDAAGTQTYYYSFPGEPLPPGYSGTNTIFYAGKTPQPGMVPLYRYKIIAHDSRRTPVYFLSYSNVPPPNFTSEGIAFYIYQTAAANTVPIYWYTIRANDFYPGTLVYLYTTNSIRPSGFSGGQVLFYTPPGP